MDLQGLAALAAAILPVAASLATAYWVLPRTRAETASIHADADETVSGTYLAWTKEFRERVVALEAQVKGLTNDVARLRETNMRLSVHNRMLSHQVTQAGMDPVPFPEGFLGLDDD